MKKTKSPTRKEIRNNIYLFLSLSRCVDCGEDRPALLDFDHIEATKKFGIAGASRKSIPWKDIASEILKCEVRCVACHRLKSAEERNWYSSIEHQQIDNLVGNLTESEKQRELQKLYRVIATAAKE